MEHLRIRVICHHAESPQLDKHYGL